MAIQRKFEITSEGFLPIKVEFNDGDLDLMQGIEQDEVLITVGADAIDDLIAAINELRPAK